LILSVCIGSHTLDTHSTDFSLRHAPPRHFPNTAFQGFHFQISADFLFAGKKRRFSTAIFHSLKMKKLSQSEGRKKNGKKSSLFLLNDSLILQNVFFLQSQMEDFSRSGSVLTINGFYINPRQFGYLSSKAIKVIMKFSSPKKAFYINHNPIKSLYCPIKSLFSL
jgi:hypothetical protein